jgi:hypothetical protein
VINGASRSAMPSSFSTAASSITPPSEVMRPPSKAAVTFLRSTVGKLKGSRLSSSMAGVAASDSVEVGVDAQISVSNQSLTLYPPAHAGQAHQSVGHAQGTRLLPLLPELFLTTVFPITRFSVSRRINRAYARSRPSRVRTLRHLPLRPQHVLSPGSPLYASSTPMRCAPSCSQRLPT